MDAPRYHRWGWLLLAGSLLLFGCSDDKKPGFDCDCPLTQVCRDGQCVDPDAGNGDAGDMGEEFIDNPDCPGAGVAISEVMYRPGSGPEWVEIRGPVDRDLTGFRILGINGNAGEELFNVALEGSLGGDGLFVIASAAFGPQSQVAADLIMQNGPDNVVLRDCGGQTIDALGYGSFATDDVFRGEGTPAPLSGQDNTIGRCPDAPDTNNNAADFHIITEPTPNEVNAGFQNPSACTVCDPEAFVGVVKISEVLADPTGSDTVDNEFIELRATPGLDMTGLIVDLINGDNGEVYRSFVIPGGTADAEGFFVIGGPDADTPLPGTIQNDHEAMVLRNCADVEIDALAWGDWGGAISPGEGATTPDPGQGNSIARCPDQDTDNNASDFSGATPTPGAENNAFLDESACGASACRPAVVLNEIATEVGGFIELRGAANVGLEAITLEVLDGDGAVVDTVAGSGPTNGAGLASFDTTALSPGGGTVRLLDCDDLAIDALAWGSGSGLDGEGTPAVGLESGEGLARCPSAELAGLDTDDNDTDFKIVDTPSRNTTNAGFADPGACGLVDCNPETLDGAILINEVLADPSGADAGGEWVELRGTPGTSLAGAELVHFNGNGNVEQWRAPLAGTVPAGGLYVVGVSGDEAQLVGSLQNDNEALQLVCSGVVIDAVAWGPIGNVDDPKGEGAPAVEPRETESIARCAGDTLGEIDTNDNATDFHVDGTPTRGGPNFGLGEVCGEEECTPDTFDGVVTINEVRAGASGFVELRGTASLPLGGITITGFAADGTGTVIELLTSATTTDANGFHSVNTGDLALAGGSVVVTDCGGGVVDALAWGTGTDLMGEGNAAEAPGASESVARCEDGLDTGDNDTDFGTSTSPTPGAANADLAEGTCPGCNALDGLVLINEINPDEWSSGSTSDTTNLLSFIELRGVPNTSLDGAQLRLINGAGGAQYTGSPIVLTGQAIPADGYWVVGEADVPNRDLERNALSLQNGPDNIILVDACGTTVDAVGYGNFGDTDVFVGEGAAVAVPSGGTTLGRSPAATLGDADTNNNSADFCVITPSTGGQAGNAGLPNPDAAGADMTCPGE